MRIRNRIAERQGSLEVLLVVVVRIADRVHLVVEYNPSPCDQLEKNTREDGLTKEKRETKLTSSTNSTDDVCTPILLFRTLVLAVT